MKCLTTKFLLTFVICLTSIAPKAAIAECPDGKRCFPLPDIRDCGKALKDYDNQKEIAQKKEDEANRLKGQLFECRKSNKQKDKTIRHLDKKAERYNHTDLDLVLYAAGGFTVGVGVGSLLITILD